VTRPPRLSGLPVLGEALGIRFSPLDLARRAFEQCGDLAFVDLGVFGTVYFAFHPDDVQEVFSGGRRLHRALLRSMLGQGLFIHQTDPFWRRQRRLIQPAFHASRIARWVEQMASCIASVLDRRWRALAEQARPFDLPSALGQITVHVILKLVFGPDDGDERTRLASDLGELVDYVDHRLFDAWKLRLLWPMPAHFAFRRRLAALRGYTERAIAARAADAASRDDLLSDLITAREAGTGEMMTTAELVDEVISIFVAGTETTGAALAWTCYLLWRHAEEQDRLRRDIAAQLGARAPTAADLPQLAGARRAVQEALRLYPPAWAMMRYLDVDRMFRGYAVPAGSRVMVSPFMTHRHPAFWDHPERFDPERFSSARSAGRPRFAYFPFGGGGHQCVANELALLEAQLVIVELLQRFRLQPVDDVELGMRPVIALSPKPSPRIWLALA
jgi:cytochrome P450